LEIRLQEIDVPYKHNLGIFLKPINTQALCHAVFSDIVYIDILPFRIFLPKKINFETEKSHDKTV